MSRTTIEWTDATWNPLVGCSVISPGCTNCYAMAQAARIERMSPGLPQYRGVTQVVNGNPVWTGAVNLAPDAKLLEPLRWKKPRRVFVNSMSDLFHESVPDEWIDRIFAIMALAPQHTFQVLTKRAKRMRAYMSDDRTPHRIARKTVDLMITGHVTPDDNWPVESIGDIDFPDDITLRQWPLPNIWLGVTTEDQSRADERIPDLFATPAAVRFVSVEPMLGPVDLTSLTVDGDMEMNALRPWSWKEVWEAAWSPEATGVSLNEAIEAFQEDGGVYPPTDDRPRGLDWVICGGESGPHARPMHPDWARALRDQCAAVGVPFFMKQMSGREKSERAAIPEDLLIRGFPNAIA